MNNLNFPNNNNNNTKDFNTQTMYRSRNQGNANVNATTTKIQPFPQQPLGNPDHQRHLNIPARRVPWSPPAPRRHGMPQHSRYNYNSEFPQQSVLLQGIFFPIRQPQNLLLNTQLMNPPLHRLQYQGLAPNGLHNKAPAGYRRSYQVAPNQFQQRPVPLEHHRVLQNHQPVSRYVNW